MKNKLLLFIALAVGSILFTSCHKICTCKVWAMGSAGDEYEIELDKDTYSACSDMNVYSEHEGLKSGIECK